MSDAETRGCGAAGALGTASGASWGDGGSSRSGAGLSSLEVRFSSDPSHPVQQGEASAAPRAQLQRFVVRMKCQDMSAA
ncbi:unnamed protein product [Rangifer tarandus platyrhynchus]|uniref:Uncharacterized protein n=2 Tax=Rangifer tarandus platyrhynchus TaxID=3082113 RepID=A0ACB0F4V1_RANTA|nr:unnamed protein product [Rangifer tarandus platyrhynchus]CAI9708000.1 unnamed protein product [Rangifer tarandus platyrhynchus]